MSTDNYQTMVENIVEYVGKNFKYLITQETDENGDMFMPSDAVNTYQILWDVVEIHGSKQPVKVLYFSNDDEHAMFRRLKNIPIMVVTESNSKEFSFYWYYCVSGIPAT